MEKIKYEFDPHNRLTVRKESMPGIRRVLDGEFKVTAKNALVYHVKAPLPAGVKIPYQIKLSGVWSLTSDHRLCLTLDKWLRRSFGDQITLQGELLDVRKNALAFAVTTRTRENTASVYVLELGGTWQADERNRLTFRVRKEKGGWDTLVFDAAWKIDDAYQIVYQYQSAGLLRKKKQIHVLTFQGAWDIADKARLAYRMDRISDAGFDFKTGIGIFKENYIAYEVGIGLASRKSPVKRTLIFEGGWKLKKGRGLVFEVRSRGKRIQYLTLGAEARLTSKENVRLKLTSSSNRDLGVEAEFSREIFQSEGQAFLRLLASKPEVSIVAGCGWRW